MSTAPQLPKTIGGWAIWLVILFGIVGVIYVVAQVAGVTIPWWVVTLFWIAVVVFVAVALIQFLRSLGGGDSP